MKINNKGITMVELLISFSLLSILIIGLFNVITMTKKDANNQAFANSMKSYTNNLDVIIQSDLIKNNLQTIDNCSTENLYCFNLNYKDKTKQLIIDSNSKVIRYDDIIYTIPEENVELDIPNITLVDNIVNISIPIYKIYDTTNYGLEITSILNI